MEIFNSVFEIQKSIHVVVICRDNHIIISIPYETTKLYHRTTVKADHVAL